MPKDAQVKETEQAGMTDEERETLKGIAESLARLIPADRRAVLFFTQGMALHATLEAERNAA